MLNAASLYLNAKTKVAPSGLATPPKPDPVSNAAQEFAALVTRPDQVAQEAMTGKADTHDLVQSIAEAELAMNTAVAIRDKIVQAYQELLRMPV